MANPFDGGDSPGFQFASLHDGGIHSPSPVELKPRPGAGIKETGRFKEPDRRFNRCDCRPARPQYLKSSFQRLGKAAPLRRTHRSSPSAAMHRNNGTLSCQDRLPLFETPQMVASHLRFINISLIEQGAQKALQQGRSRKKTGGVNLFHPPSPKRAKTHPSVWATLRIFWR